MIHIRLINSYRKTWPASYLIDIDRDIQYIDDLFHYQMKVLASNLCDLSLY